MPVSFFFANYGGKDGTISNFKVKFTPNENFKFFKSFSANLREWETNMENSTLPLTIEKGSNRYLKFSLQFHTIDWKETALAEVLNPQLTVRDIVNRALEKSKDTFRDFCGYMETKEELGKVSCTATFTKGRFKTHMRDEEIITDFVVKNECNLSLVTLRRHMEEWEEHSKNRNDLENYLIRDIQCLIKELDNNFRSLANCLDFYEFLKQGPTGKVRVNDFENLELTQNNERRIRWFIIKTSKDFEDELVAIYDRFKEYNGTIDKIVAQGEVRTKSDIEKLNTERAQLQVDVLKIKDNLAKLQLKFMREGGN